MAIADTTVASLRSRHPDRFVVEPLIAGETIQRSFPIGYLRHTVDKPDRDFGVIPDIVEDLLIEPVPDAFLQDQALAHLNDAANKDLSIDARRQHFDLAGQCMLEGTRHRRTGAVRRWVEAGGV